MWCRLFLVRMTLTINSTLAGCEQLYKPILQTQDEEIPFLWIVPFQMFQDPKKFRVPEVKLQGENKHKVVYYVMGV